MHAEITTWTRSCLSIQIPIITCSCMHIILKFVFRTAQGLEACAVGLEWDSQNWSGISCFLDFLVSTMVGRRCWTLESSLVPSSSPRSSDAASSEPCQGQGAVLAAFQCCTCPAHLRGVAHVYLPWRIKSVIWQLDFSSVTIIFSLSHFWDFINHINGYSLDMLGFLKHCIPS